MRYVEINLDKLKQNINNILKDVTQEQIIAVLKADAYGHGIKKIYETLYKLGITHFAVATYEEAIKIYDEKDDADILILGNTPLSKLKSIENTNILITVYSETQLEYMQEHNLKNRIHIKYDSGMNRLGFKKENICSIDKYLHILNIEGIYTHLSSVDTDTEYTDNQIKQFQENTSKYFLKKHILSSQSLKKYKDSSIIGDYVRIGHSIYEGVMSFYSEVCHIYKTERAEYISYNKSYKTDANTYIAVISVGYADGYKRILSNRSSVYINGKKYRVVGNICMDLMMVEVDENIKIGDRVELFGKNISIYEISTLAETIDYEIMTSIGNRVDRIYKETL